MTPRGNRLSILYVGALPPFPGGTAIVGAQLLVGLANLGHSVRALAPITAQTLRDGDQFAPAHPGIGIAWFDVPFFQASIDVTAEQRRIQDQQISERLPGLIADARPDAVILGSWPFAMSAPTLARAAGIPSLLIIHASNARRFLAALDRAMLERLMDQLRQVDRFVLVAEHLASEAHELGLGDYRVIPNGVDLHAFSPRPKDAGLLRRLDLRDDQIIVAYVAYLKQVKRPLDVVSSAERILRDRPDIVYLIVGDGPDRAAMEEHCRKKQILGSFRFVGWVDHERVPEYLNLADIVVMPSEIEALALVYLEAQACGRLLLASDIPAAREVVEDERTGLLFKKGDVGDLAAQTLRAAGDADLRAAIGRRARESVQTHDVDRTVAAYEQAVRDVVRRPLR